MLRVKIIPQAFFFFFGSYVRHLQHPTPQDQSLQPITFFLLLNWSINLNRHILPHWHSQSVFLSVSQLVYRNSNSYYRLPPLLSSDISLDPGPFYDLKPLDHNERNIFDIEDYIFFASTSTVCCRKLMNLGT